MGGGSHGGGAIASLVLETWHRLVQSGETAGLDDLLAEEVVFHSPVVHSPLSGKRIATQYLTAAFRVLRSDSFRYLREIVGASDAALEFETRIDGIHVNGVDLIRWNADGKIVDFKVMIRPLKAIHLVQQKMAAMLESGR